jgi:pimeloyl-ACP methyl ester carboxylesterase
LKEIFQFGPFRLDTAARQLWRGTEIIPLPPKSFDLLAYLVEHHGELQTRDDLFSALWPGTFVDDHALSVQIREIRKGLGDNAHTPTYIETRHRRGYCFRAPVSRLSHTDVSQPLRPSAHVPDTLYTASGNVNIAYQVIGDAPIDLVFIMGWVSHLEYFWTEPRFASFLRRLSSFARVILFDKRGTGLSDHVPVNELPTIEQRMEDLNTVMRAAGSERAVICGISEGGCMSAVFAATYPERTLGLIMIGTYARRIRATDYPWAPTPEEREHFIREIQEHWGGPVGIEQRAPSLAGDQHFRQWWATYLRMGASPGAAVALTRMNSEVDIRHVLPTIRVPALVLHRTDDMCLKLQEGRYLAENIPGARFVEVPGIDHLPFVGDQESIIHPIEEFIDELKHDLEHDRSLATVLTMRFIGEASRPAFVEDVRTHLARFRASTTEHHERACVAAFDGPARAVNAARALVDAATSHGCTATAGLHTGECIVSNGIRGTALTIANRICECAKGGEILVSGTLRDLVAGSGLLFEPRGRIEAGDLGEWQLLRVKL